MMTEADLRDMIRDAVVRHLGPPGGTEPRPAAVSAPAAAPHPSQVLYLTITNPGDACVIEPGVGCNHCGYCKTHGF